MAETMVIHPLNRGIRPIRVELNLESGRVTGAKVGTTYYWDFAQTLRGKDPLDALQFTQRTSGIDFISHAAACARALEKIAKVQITGLASLTRNILLALDMVYGHITHFYQKVLPDYIPISDRGPFYAGYGDYRIPSGMKDNMVNNMWRAFEIRQLIHSMMAILAGKAPHICSIVAGGVTRAVNSAEVVRIQSILEKVTNFVNKEYSVDLNIVEQAYPQYFDIGGGAGNILALGEFPLDKPEDCLLPAGTNFTGVGLDMQSISIDYACSWFEAENTGESPLNIRLKPAPEKPGAYSWIKGAVFGQKTCEVGPLARMLLLGNSGVSSLGNRASSVLGRYRARLEESKWLLDQVAGWLERLDPQQQPAIPGEIPDQGEAIGFAEASNGSVIHYMTIKDGKIDNYNVLDAYSWNLCPRTIGGTAGPMESALSGLSAAGPEISPQILRVARSF